VTLLKEAGVDVVIDVRESTWTRKPGFFKTRMATDLAAAGIGYHHAGFAGHPRSLRQDLTNNTEIVARFRTHLAQNPGISVELDQLIESFISEGKRVALTSFPRHPDDCHRSVLAEAWANVPTRNVEHIGPEGCQRPVVAHVGG
jgi:uncharacterized protein (DUF488 family)